MRCIPLHPEFKRVRSSTELPPTSLCTGVEEKWKIFNAKDGGRGFYYPYSATKHWTVTTVTASITEKKNNQLINWKKNVVTRHQQARALRLEFENISRKFVTCTIFACASFFLTFFCQTKTGSTRASINITKDSLTFLEYF